ncbi:MAG TPA: lysylphosphatidylglycerol synthase transmembrane domain-containing protein [Myxococcales bacterium]|nr:lysylphosphatidylglycerol synthase transmembrane domain-containing protein [Myxococcales bacterium]
MRRRLLFALRICAWVMVGAFAVLAARRLDWDQVFRAFAHADVGLLALATIVGLPCTLLAGLRWSSLVKAVRPVPRLTAVAAMYVGQAASALLPMRAGEAVRTELLARATGMGRATSLGTVALDHSVNGVVMFLFAAVLPALLPVPRWLAALVWIGACGAIALGLLLLRLAQHPEQVPSGRLAAIAVRVRSGLMAARSPRAVAQAAAFAALSWSVEIVTAMIALHAFDLPHDLAHAMAVLFGVNLALAIPAPPAALGSFELGAGLALTAFGGHTERAAAFALGYHALQLLPTLVMGGVMLPAVRRPARVAPLGDGLTQHA